MEAQPTPTVAVPRAQIEQQLVMNRAKLQETTQQLEQLTEQRDSLEQQVVAALAAIEGWNMGHAFAQTEAAEAERAKADEEQKPAKPKKV